MSQEPAYSQLWKFGEPVSMPLKTFLNDILRQAHSWNIGFFNDHYWVSLSGFKEIDTNSPLYAENDFEGRGETLDEAVQNFFMKLGSRTIGDGKSKIRVKLEIETTL